MSTRLAPITGGIIVLVLFGFAWIAGIATELGATLHNTPIVTAGTLFGLLIPTDGLWRGAIYNLEPSMFLAIGNDWARGNPFSVTSPPPVPSMLWTVAWAVSVSALGIVSFSRRDI